MSGDEPDSSDPSGTLGRLRSIPGAAGIAALTVLAGCSTGPDPEPAATAADETVEPSSPTPGAGRSTTPPATSPTATLAPAECRDRAEELGSELEAVDAEIEELAAELPTLRRRRDNLEQTATLFDVPADDTVAQAKAVGTAARDAVVFLEFSNGSATGWYVADNHVITNAHNVFNHHSGEERSVTVWTMDGDSYEGTTVAFVESLMPDVALVRTDEPGPASLPTGTTPDRDSTEPLVQVGHPGGIGNWVITLGHLRNFQEVQAPDGTILTELLSTVPGRSGVSGSPVMDLDGDVVGLTYAGQSIENRQPGEPPLVAEPTVYDRPIAPLSWGNHVTIDTVMTYYEEWT